MNDSCLSKQVERYPWPPASLILVWATNPPEDSPHTSATSGGPFGGAFAGRNQSLTGSLTKLSTLSARQHHSPYQSLYFQRNASFFFVLSKPWSLVAALLQDFLRADKTEDIWGNKHSSEITSHLSCAKRIIWTQFGLWGVTGRRCYGNKTKAVSYLAPCRGSASMWAHKHTHMKKGRHNHMA